MVIKREEGSENSFKFEFPEIKQKFISFQVVLIVSSIIKSYQHG